MVAPLPVVGEHGPPIPTQRLEASVLHWNLLALAVALTAVGGSLWLSLGMGLRACPLCFYQRAFMMGAAAALLMALLTETRSSASVSLLALPMAAAGLGVAGYHVYLELAGKLECPAGLCGVGTAPQQSLAAFGLLFLLLVFAGHRRPAMVIALVLGAFMAVGCVVSIHAVQLPADAFEGPPTICRPIISKES
jgi:disulfide bond formation protein DsbB